MTSRKASLGELETLMLLAVLRLEGDASARRIRHEVGTRGGRDWEISLEASVRGLTFADDELYAVADRGIYQWIFRRI